VRKLIQIAIILALLLLSAGLVSAATEIGVTIDGVQVGFDQSTGQPFIDENNRTQVPFRQALEAFGATVSWDQGTRTATAVKGGVTVQVPIDADYIYRNDRMIVNDTAATIKAGRTYLPIRVVMEAFDADVYWDSSTKVVEVESKDIKRYNYDLSKYVKLGKYKGMEVAAESITVTNEEVQDEIDYWLKSAGTMENLSKGAVKKGDIVNIDYKGMLDGKPFDGGTDEGVELEIGSGQFIPGFEEGLIGKNIGERVTLQVTFPADYAYSELAGKKVAFNVKINSAVRYIPAKLDTEFVKAYSDFNTVKEFKDSIADGLKKEKSYDVRGTLWDSFVENCEVTGYPEKELKHEISAINNYYRSQARSNFIEWQEFLEMNMMDQAVFDAAVLEDVQRQMGLEMILYALARQEKLELTAKDYKDGILGYLMEDGFDSLEAFESAYGESYEKTVFGGKKFVELTLLYDRVTEFLVDNAKPIK